MPNKTPYIRRAAPEPDVVYHGYGPQSRAGGRLVVIEIAGEIVGPLPHAAKHSPSGFSWGYTGSGPADLARSLLIHTLGDAARCAVCDGTTEVAYDTVTDTEIPAQRAGDQAGDGRESSVTPRFSEPMGCCACENGCAVMPSLYQRFKFDVIAQLPEHGWTLSRAEVRAWVDQHRTSAES